MLNNRLLFGLILFFIMGLSLRIGAPQAIAAKSEPVNLPIGIETFKIVVEEDGIYEIDQPTLAAAGMDVAGVNPADLVMMHRGEAVSYEFIGDGDATFEANEKIRFYGGRFTDSRHEDLFYTKSVFWIWAGRGGGSRINTVNNSTGGTLATQWNSSITVDPMNSFYPTYTDRWSTFDNEPDAWYWLRFDNAQLQELPLELPNPAPTGTGEMTVEIMSFAANDVINHDIEVQIGSAPATTLLWNGVRNVNVISPIPAGSLVDGTNTVSIIGDTRDVNGDLRYDQFYLNRITVEYPRQFVAVDDQLIFNYETAGATDFAISGFSTSSVMVWELTDVLNPVKVAIGSGDVTGGVLSFGRNLPAQSKFIATTAANLLTPTEITAYTPVDIQPDGGAEWVAIAHESLVGEAERLAAHRATTSVLKTHVVDVEDVYNQFGHGYPIPAAIKGYTQNAYDNWETQIRYLVLVGDATQNPDKLPCPGCSSSSWNTDEETYVIADLQFEDRFLGLIPTDHTFTLLEGDDIKPDIAIGRMSSRTAEEAQIFVDKIIEYDQSTLAEESWTRRLIFLADNRDAGGNFCFENQYVGDGLPNDFAQTAFCLDDYGGDTSQAKGQIRSDFFNELASNSAGIVNYRGHGSITDWGSGIVKREDSNLFLNVDRPTVIISADCLDGNFVWLGGESQAPDYASALSETFLRLDGRGTAAHWGSSGLGYSSEHTVMHTGFYEALYGGGARTIGDAVQYSKTRYIDRNQHDSEVYAFILHGDPAMILPSTQQAGVDTTPETNSKSDAPTAQVSYDVTVTNQGTGPDTIDITLSGNQWAASADMTAITLSSGASATVRVTHTVAANALAGESDTITLTARSHFNGTVFDTTTLQTTATAVYDVDVRAAITAQSGSNNSTVSYNVVIENTSNIDETFDIVLRNSEWDVNAPSSVFIAVGESKTIVVEHVIPLLQHSAQDSVQVWVTSSADSSVSDSVTLTTSAEVYSLFLPTIRQAAAD